MSHGALVPLQGCELRGLVAFSQVKTPRPGASQVAGGKVRRSLGGAGSDHSALPPPRGRGPAGASSSSPQPDLAGSEGPLSQNSSNVNSRARWLWGRRGGVQAAGRPRL